MIYYISNKYINVVKIHYTFLRGFKMIQLIEKQSKKTISNDDIEYYLRIINSIERTKDNREKLEIWKYGTIIKLMSELKKNKEKDFVTNVLVLLLTLTEKQSLDSSNSQSIDSSSLSKEDKEEILMILKNEFLPEKNYIISIIR